MDKFIPSLTEKLDLPARELADIYREAKEKGSFVIQDLVERYPEKEKALLDLYSNQFRVKVADLSEKDIPPNIISLIDRQIAQKFQIIPLDRVGNVIIIATLNPHDLKLIDNIRFKTGFKPQPVFATKAAISEAMQKYYKMKDIGITNLKASVQSKQKKEERSVIKETAHDPIVTLVNQVLLQCVQRGASDIHMEPYEAYLRIRLRIDGSLIEIARPPAGYKDQLTSRVKIMAKLDIAERRIPQDGGIRTIIDNKPIDFRVNSCPTIYGEKIVLRILDKSSLEVDMTKLGFEGDDLEKFRTSIHKPFGMVLVTGPTGSGKTTTLYSALQDLNKVSENITTAEDPVEFNLDGINQVQINEAVKLTFSKALKAFLRQDPDIIMVGEIRDLETGAIAIKAALTGHLVLSTLHTNNAADTITRMVDMGLEPFNLISSLNCVVAQRLMRKLCLKCREIDTTKEGARLLGYRPEQLARVTLYKHKGCDACSGSGYRGRTAVHEVLALTDPIKQAIMQGKSSIDLKKIAMAEGMRTLRLNALRKMLRGETDVLEVYKNTASDNEREE